MDLRSCKTRLSSWSSMIVRTVIILQLTDVNRGESLADSQYRMFAMIGHTQNVTLPCSVSPATDVVDQMVEWSRSDLNPRFVHVRRSGEDRLVDQNPSFKGRTSVSTDGLKVGDASLKLTKVRLSDEGTYRCFIPGLKTDLSVELVVEADIKITTVSTGMLECNSEGWDPEPEVLWLESEQKLLPAGAKEVFRGPDGLYSLSSRLTLEKGHSNNFTCRVQQKNLHREAKIQVPDDFFMDSSPSARSVIGGLIAGIMFIIIVLLFVLIWICRKNKEETKKICEDGESQSGRKDNRCSSSKDPVKQPLMKNEEEHKGGSETLMDQGQVDVHHAAHVSEQPTLSCENERFSISPDQVTQNENQQNNDEPGRDATSDVFRDENTQSADQRPSLTEQETHPEPDDDNIEIPNQSLMDNSGQQQQLNKGEDVKKNTDKKTKNDETAGQSPREGEGKQNTEGKNNPDVQKEDGEKTGATNKEAAETLQPNPAEEQTEEGQKHQEDDSRSISNIEPSHPENGTKQQPSDSTDQPDVKDPVKQPLMKKEEEHKGGSETLMDQGQVDVHHAAHVSEKNLSGNYLEPNEGSKGGGQPASSTTSGDATSGQKERNNNDNGEKTETTNHAKTASTNKDTSHNDQADRRQTQEEQNSSDKANEPQTDAESSHDGSSDHAGNNELHNNEENQSGKPSATDGGPVVPDQQQGNSTTSRAATSGQKEQNNHDSGEKTETKTNEIAETLQPNPGKEEPEEAQVLQGEDKRSISKTHASHPENNETSQQPSDSSVQPNIETKLSGNNSEPDDGSEGGGQPGRSTTPGDATSGQKEKNNGDDGEKTETTNHAKTASTNKEMSHNDQAEGGETQEEQNSKEKANEPQTDAEFSHDGSSGNYEPPNNEENQSGNPSAAGGGPVVPDQQQEHSTTSSAATSDLNDQKIGAKGETPETDEGSSHNDQAGGAETQTDAEASHAGSFEHSGNNEPPNNEENQSGNPSGPVVPDQQQEHSTSSSAATSDLNDQTNGAKGETPETEESSSPNNQAGRAETQTEQGDKEEGSKPEHDAQLEEHDSDQEKPQ